MIHTTNAMTRYDLTLIFEIIFPTDLLQKDLHPIFTPLTVPSLTRPETLVRRTVSMAVSEHPI